MFHVEVPPRVSTEETCANLLRVGAVTLRDVDGRLGEPEDPYVYSTGNQGPSYVDVKGGVGSQDTFKSGVAQVAYKMVDGGIDIDWVAGNATGGMVPSAILRDYYQELIGRETGYVYIRGSRKKGGKGELITGLEHVPRTRDDGTPTRFMVGEELVNFAGTTTTSGLLLRSEGFVADHGSAILSYDHKPQRERLQETGMTLVAAVTLAEVMDVARETNHFDPALMEQYDEFAADPKAWMAAHGLEQIDMETYEG